MTPFEAASYWFVRQDAQAMTAADRREFESWLGSCETHRRAYEQTGSMWRHFEESADEGELRALRVAALATAPVVKVWPRAAAVAAGVLAIVGLAALAWHSQLSQPPSPVSGRGAEGEGLFPNAAQYATAHNQRSTVTLPDGTLVSMNLDTAFAMEFSASQRLIHLTKGQALFDVAKDRQRPFIVTAADRHIQALGTQFDVRLEPNRVEVVLVEGRVSVDQSNPSLLDKIVRRSTRVELEPGQRLVAAVGKSASITAINAAQATSWREGWVVFEDETVEQAIAELNRYSDRPIVADEAVKRLRLSGVFRIGRPDRFGAVIQELLPISVEHGSSGETVLVLKPNTHAGG